MRIRTVQNIAISLLLTIFSFTRTEGAALSQDGGYEQLQILSAKNLNASASITEDSLIELAREVGKSAQKSGNTLHEYKAAQIEANAYAQRGDFGLASSKAQQMLEKVQHSNDPWAKGLALEAMANAYMHAYRYAQADSLLTEARLLLEVCDEPFIKLQILLQHLHTTIRLRHTDKAQAILTKAHLLIAEQRSSILELNEYIIMLDFYDASLSIMTRNMGRAKRMLNKIENQRLIDPELSLWHHNLLSKYYTQTAEYNKAVTYSDSMVMEAYTRPNRNILREALRSHSALLTTLERSENACDNYKELIALDDSLFKQRYTAQMDSLHVMYLVDHLKTSNYIRRNSLYTKVILGLLLLTLIIGALYLFIRRKNRQLEASRLKLQAMREASAESIRAKSLFLSNMSHELRTPLNGIVGFTTILTAEEEYDDETRQQCSGYIRQNADLLMKLISDIVDFSNLQGNSMRFTFDTCDVVTLCRNVIETVGNVKQTEAKLNVDIQLDRLELYTDTNRLQQVLINILINATKFTKKGDITLRLTTDIKRDMAVFTIEDTGCGIPADRQSRIFERFEKLHEQTQGAGLGLSICKLIIEHLGGDISLDGSYTQGARFVFTHPLHLNPNEN